MATESEIKNYSNLLSETMLSSLNSVKNTYVEQISTAKSELEKTSFAGWEDDVSSKFQLYYEPLKKQYSAIESDVGAGSNLETLIKIVNGLKTKCDEYLGYLDEYNSISTGVSFSDEKLKKEYNDYKNGRIKYNQLSQSVKSAINNSNSKLKRKKTLEDLMNSCSSKIDTILTNIKSITFNAPNEQMANIETDFKEETVPQDNGHYTIEQVREQYQTSKQKYEDLLAKLKEIDLDSLDTEEKINAFFPEAYEILRRYSDSLFLMYLKGEISYDDYMSSSDIGKMKVAEDRMYGSIYDVLYEYSDYSTNVNIWANQNNEYRRFADRFNSDGRSSQEFLQNVSDLSTFYQEGTDIDYNNVETASQYAVAALVELLENGYTGDIILAKRDSDGDIFKAFNNKAGDRNWKNGFMDSAKEISYQSIDFYHNNGGAFNTNYETATQEGGSGTHVSESGVVHGGGSRSF